MGCSLGCTHSGNYDGALIKEVVPQVTGHFIGVTVQTYLDENGDQAIANFAFYTLTKTDGEFEFKEVAYYDGSTNKSSFSV